MECQTCFSKPAEKDGDECFRCRIAGVSFSLKSSGGVGRAGWNRTANEWRLENFGTSSEKELAARGIVPADKD